MTGEEPPASMMDNLFDLCWRKDDRHGADLCQTGKGVDPEILVRFSWAPQYSDGWRRYAWTVIERQPPRTLSLIVFASPEVEVGIWRGGKDSMAPGLIMTVAVVRLQRADSIPQPGEPIPIGELLAPEIAVVASTQSTVDGLFQMAATNPAIVRALDSQTAHVRQLPTGLVVSHHSWQVQVTLDQPRASAAFSVEVSPHPAPGLFLEAPSVFLVTVIRQGEVSVKYLQVSDRVALPLVGFQERHSRADVVILDVDPTAAIPMSGLFPEMTKKQSTVEPETLFAPSFESAMFDFAFYGSTIAALASIPTGMVGLAIIGTVYDVSLLMYAATTGRDFEGEDVTQWQLLQMGLFGMLSVVGDLSSATLKLAKQVEGKLFVNLGTDLVHTNPGFWSALSPMVRRHLSPVVVDALERMPDADALRLLQGIDDSIGSVSLIKVKNLSVIVDATLTPLLKATKYIDNIPAPLYADAMNMVDIVDSETFELLGWADRMAALSRYRRAVEASDPSLLNLREISEVLAAEYTARIGEAAIARVFNPGLTGFRRAVWGPITSSLELGYRTYESGKVLTGKGYRNVLEWALAQAGNSRYIPLLAAELGPDIVKLLRPIVRAARYEVTPSVARFYESVAGKLISYKVAREMASGEGAGFVTNADHLLEQRFLHTYEGLEGYGQGEFLSLIVPYNSTSVENLRRAFIEAGLPALKVPYTHVHKTARMEALAPKSMQGKFTVQDIYNAYRLLYIHEYGFGEQLFGATLEGIFTDLLRLTKIEAREAGSKAATDIRLQHARSVRALDTSPKTAQQLTQALIKARKR